MTDRIWYRSSDRRGLGFSSSMHRSDIHVRECGPGQITWVSCTVHCGWKWHLTGEGNHSEVVTVDPQDVIDRFPELETWVVEQQAELQTQARRWAELWLTRSGRYREQAIEMRRKREIGV